MEKENKRIQLIGIGVFLLYFIYNQFSMFPFYLLGINYSSLPMICKTIYMLSYEFFFISILYFIYRKRLIKDFKEFKNNFKPYMKKYIEYWVLAFGLMILSNILIMLLFPNSSATNQENINEIFKIAPIYMFISAAIFAPIIEEIVFRLSFRNMFKNDYLFIILSGLTFGAMHVIGSFNSFIDLIHIIPYSIPGFVFAYTLTKSKNIFIPISLHCFHNTFMMLLQIILVLFL